MANIIDSLKFGDKTGVFTLPYGSCSTAAGTAAKTVAVQGGNFSLETGARVLVKFTVTNTASSPTLNVSGTGAKAIYYRGSAISAGSLAANRIYEFVYNGTQWDLVGDINTNYTSKAVLCDSKTATSYSVSGKYLNLIENGTVRSSVQFTSSDAIDISSMNGSDTSCFLYFDHNGTPGYKHIPSGGSSGQILKWESNGKAAWSDGFTPYSNYIATNTHGIQYVGLPVATVVPANEDEGTDEEAFILPFATSNRAGIIKPGKGLYVDGTGTLSTNAPVPASWKEVQEIVQMGEAANHFSIGDQLVCQHTEFGQLTWDVIGIDHDTPYNTTSGHSLTLCLHNALQLQLPFDEPEISPSSSTRISYGNNYYKLSSIRQWINADGAAGQWWTATHSGDKKPSFSENTPGFLFGLDKEMLECVGAVSKITVKPQKDGVDVETLNDKFFLLSATEIYAKEYNLMWLEGEPYAYFTQLANNAGYSTGARPSRIKYLDGIPCTWLLRSCEESASNDYTIRRVSDTGAVTVGSAYSSKGIVIACCIV